jgi:hypothetical protein
LARKKDDGLTVMDLITPGELELIGLVREAEKFTRYGWDRYGRRWQDNTPHLLNIREWCRPELLDTPMGSQLLEAERPKPMVDAFTRYFLGGFRFQRHQIPLHYSPIADIQIMGGVGSGKTTPATISAIVRASVNPGYSILWVAPILPQARLAYEIVLQWGLGSRWGELFLKDHRKHPYPVIELRPWDKHDPGGKLECRSLGQDPAELLRGGEYDEAVADEAMRAYITSWYVALLSGRLRGPRPYMLSAHPELQAEYIARVEDIEWEEDPNEIRAMRRELEEWVYDSGLARQTRLTVIGNAPRGAEWWRRWDRGFSHPNERYSARWSTRQNLYVSQRQLTLQERQFKGRETELAVELDAMKPPASGDVFPNLRSFFSGQLRNLAIQAVADNEPGWVFKTLEEYDLYHYEKPPEKDAAYAFALDPGAGILGKRNEWVLLGCRIDRNPSSDDPMPFEIVYIRAGNIEGQHGSPNPWIRACRDVRSRYPIPYGMFGVESSGVQKNTHQVVWPDDLVMTPIFLNNVMNTLIIEAQRTVASEMWYVPDCALFSDQMSEFRYKMKDDEAQDFVSAFLILNHLVYIFVHEKFEMAEAEPPEHEYWEWQQLDPREVRDSVREVRVR